MALEQIRQTLPTFRSAVDGGSGDFGTARTTLGKLKLAMTELPSQQSAGAETMPSADESAVCREVLDYAAILSIKMSDHTSFERHIAQARSYYSRASESAEASQRRLLITGLHLMILLVDGRFGEFHMRVETLSDDEIKAEAVALPLRLEALLADGSYNKVLAARSALAPGLSLFVPLLDKLAGTVQDSFALCASAAYPSLRVSDAVSLLRLPSPGALQSFITAKALDWSPVDGVPARLSLRQGDKVKPSLDANETMKKMLMYATEVERIV